MLLAYHCEVTGSSANVFQEEFFNWEAYASILITEKPFETLKSHLVHSSTYHNGIQVCSSHSMYLTTLSLMSIFNPST